MNRGELVKLMAIKADTTQEAANALLGSFIDCITQAVADGEKVTIVGFGTFESRDRAARPGRNPKTGKPITIPAAVVPVFIPGKNFREAVNK